MRLSLLSVMFRAIISFSLSNCYPSIDGFKTILRNARLCTAKPSVFTPVSFFKFHDIPASQQEALMKKTSQELMRLNAKGTVLFSTEGVNGQLVIPSVNKTTFIDAIKEVDVEIFDGLVFNFDFTREYRSFSDDCSAFKKLVVRGKKKILTDGLEMEQLNWNTNGKSIDPAEWHKLTCGSKQLGSPVVLDCRNRYESDMGRFKMAQPLETAVFSDSWAVLDTILADVPKDQAIVTYCTGGIRCVKVNAYLVQKMGFSNVGSLEKGIIGYENWLSEENRRRKEQGLDMLQSSFKGTNFLFDRRRLQQQQGDGDDEIC